MIPRYYFASEAEVTFEFKNSIDQITAFFRDLEFNWCLQGVSLK